MSKEKEGNHLFATDEQFETHLWYQHEQWTKSYKKWNGKITCSQIIQTLYENKACRVILSSMQALMLSTFIKTLLVYVFILSLDLVF